MSKHKIRINKTCQNCGAFVEQHYCPKCGQENSESRQSFHHVFTHFVFDFLHYDSSFWRTAKYLFLSPGKLSLEYMNGKRKSYVNPFTLYIFISFIAFFIPPLLPEVSAPNKEKIQKEISENVNSDSLDTIIAKLDVNKKNLINEAKIPEKVSKIEDKINNSGVDEKTENETKQFIAGILKNVKDKEKGEKAIEFFIHNIPKVLFIYMPLFAFWLWLFHNKKKKYYFDSAVFTLHFFSTTLLTITIATTLSCLFDWLNLNTTFYFLLYSFATLYVTFYFFRGNRVFFEENRFVSNLKSFVLIGINSFFIFLTFTFYLVFVVYMIYT